MFKRLLGINKLENNFKIVGKSLNRSWEWINHLNKNNSGYEERIAILEKSNMHLIDVTRELINQLQTAEPEEVVEGPEVVVPRVVNNVNLPDKDLLILQLVYQYAAFDKENAVDTNTLFGNLTYKITSRGLRKKLNSLVDNGLLRTAKQGNARYWYLNAGTLGKIKKSLKARE